MTSTQKSAIYRLMRRNSRASPDREHWQHFGDVWLGRFSNDKKKYVVLFDDKTENVDVYLLKQEYNMNLLH